MYTHAHYGDLFILNRILTEKNRFKKKTKKMCKFRPENIDLIKKSQFHYTTCMSGTRQATRYKLTANDSRSITEKAVASTTRPRRDKTSLTPTLLNHRSSNMGRRTQMYHLRSTITKFKFLKLVFHIEF